MITVTPLRPDDLDATTTLHLQHLRMGLFPKLGGAFMRRYQESFAHSPYGIALVARDEGRVIGALFATTSNSAHYRWVVRNQGWRLGTSGLAALATRPLLALRFLSTRGPRYARAISRRLAPASEVAPRASRDGPLSVLSHIVVDADARRRGVGRTLVRAFARQAREEGARRALLVTEEGGLGTGFFERIGARLLAQRRGQDGSLVREYRLILGETPAYERIERDRGGRTFVRSYHPGGGAIAGLSAASGRRAG